MRRNSNTWRVFVIATFHALTKSFGDLAAVEVWLDCVDGRREEQAA